MSRNSAVGLGVSVALAAALLTSACSETGTQPNAPVSRVDVTPAAASIGLGGSFQFTATARDRDGRPLPGRQVTWSLDPTIVASVSPTGLVTATAVGTATLRAVSEGKEATATVTVTEAPRPVASVTLDRDYVELGEGDQTQLVATLRDAEGNVLSDRTVTWISLDPGVASVTAAGLVTAIGPYTTEITASAEAKSASATVVVGGNYAYDLIHSGWPDYPAGAWRLFVARLGASQSTAVLSPDVLPDFGFNQAAVSADGRRIAFTGYQSSADVRYIFVANTDGSDLRQLTTGGHESQPAWSPDGMRIAYVVRPRNQQGDIWVMNAGGTNPVNLTGGINSTNQYSPAWSPELPGGSRIAFGEGDANRSIIWTMRPDGTDRRRVTNGDRWWDDDPSWSPDGTRIAFQREGPGTDGFDIWVSDAAGANAVSLVKLANGQAYPEWSPDGRFIAFNSSHAVNPNDWFAIYTVWNDGSKLVRRTFDPWMSARPAWRVRP